jgi:hypothetical protein
MASLKRRDHYHGLASPWQGKGFLHKWWASMILKVTERYFFGDPKFLKVKGSMNLMIFEYADLMVR